MERKGGNTKKGLVRALVRVGSKADHRPAVARKGAPVRDQTVCSGCGAVFSGRTWRRSALRLRAAAQHGSVRGICPACLQTAKGQPFGRVVLEGSYVPGHAEELIRRVRNVAARAAFTQPERRLIEVTPRRSTIEVLTTSQKLAHRLAREMVKAFRGSVSYHWSDGDGSLLAVWRRD
jgi:transposase